MPKSPITSLKVAKPQTLNNVTDANLMIPIKYTKYTKPTKFALIRFAHINCDVAQPRISKRIPYLEAFAIWANDTVSHGATTENSIRSLVEPLRTYICFSDYMKLDPFSEDAYFAYLGADGELWRQVRIYQAGRYLFEYDDGDELGIKEATGKGKLTSINKALKICGFATTDLRNQCKPFLGDKGSSQVLPYQKNEQEIIIRRTSDTFFVLAAELITAKKNNLTLPDKIEVPVDYFGQVEYVSFETHMSVTNYTVRTKKQENINHNCAFNQCMLMAYTLMCYFTSLNDSVIKHLSHPINIETDKRDKNLKTVTVSGFKNRANKEVDAVLSNEGDQINFEVDKRDGITFMGVLKELSLLYNNSSDGRLLYELNAEGEASTSFEISTMSKVASAKLLLLSNRRVNIVDWLIDCFTLLAENQTRYSLGVDKGLKGQRIVTRKLEKVSLMSATSGCKNLAFAILSCLTTAQLKNTLLPLTYHAEDEQGNVKVEFKYLDESTGSFILPAKYQSFLEILEKWSASRSLASTAIKYLIPFAGGNHQKTRQWKGMSPLAYTTLGDFGIEHGLFHINLCSSRFRKTTSDEEYSDTNISHAINLLQSTLDTLEKNYINGDPNQNKRIISQSVKVLQQLSEGLDIEGAKQSVCDELNIRMLTHDEWLKRKKPSNPNGLDCNGKQDLIRGKKRQRETNRKLGADLPCSEFDMCHLCKSAKGIDEPNSVYKLISFVDVLKEALDRYPEAKLEVKEKITAFEQILLSASDAVYVEAMNLFNINGRHSRVSIEFV